MARSGKIPNTSTNLRSSKDGALTKCTQCQIDPVTHMAKTFMKFFLVCALAVLGPTTLSAQSSGHPDASGISVVKSSWIKQRVNWEGDPFGNQTDPVEDSKIPQRNDKRMMELRKGGTTPEADRLTRDTGTNLNYEIDKNKPVRFRFLYKTLLLNTGTKTTKVIDWDYVFSDSTTKTELGRRQFTNVASVAPGKSKELKLLTISPPSRIVNLSSLSKNERNNLSETVVIVRVEYMDGSVWQLHNAATKQ